MISDAKPVQDKNLRMMKLHNTFDFIGQTNPDPKQRISIQGQSLGTELTFFEQLTSALIALVHLHGPIP
jgi:hypothetical protein